MRVLVLGGTGMLGSAVVKYLAKSGFDVTFTCRKESLKVADNFLVACSYFNMKGIVFNPLNSIEIDSLLSSNYSYVINCIGVITPAIKNAGTANTIEINSVFPHKLAKHCHAHGIKCIHITTDCVFSGESGGYTEEDKHDANNLYGRSKSLGEPIDKAMVIRTSIIGEEIHNNASLVEWAKSNKGCEVNGFTNHTWNGITTTQYAKICGRIMHNNWYEPGLFHVFSPNVVTKAGLLRMINDRFDLGLKINPFQTEISVHRSLKTTRDLNEKLGIPMIKDQIAEI